MPRASRWLAPALAGGLALSQAGCCYPLLLELINTTSDTVRIKVEARDRPCEAAPGARCLVTYRSRVTVASPSLRWEYELRPSWYGCGGAPRSDPWVEHRGIPRLSVLPARVEADGTLVAVLPRDEAAQANPRQAPGFPLKPARTATGPTCANVSAELLGLALGPREQHWWFGLRQGIKRKGTVEEADGAGFEKLKGKSDGVDYRHIVARYDRGGFFAVEATARMKSEPDHGFARLVAAVSTAASAQPRLSDAGAAFPCEGSLELTVKPTAFEGRPHVVIGLAAK